MNSILVPARLLEEPRQHALLDLQTVRHVRPVDRIALRLGLWLLLRSTRRIQHQRSHGDHARDAAALRALEERERSQERARAARHLRV